ncbi:MAG: sodium:calcium antiporter [Planctomycetota bacterium]
MPQAALGTPPSGFNTLASLLPHEWFAHRPEWLLVVIAIVGMVFVIKGADWLVEGAAGVAKKLGMPEVVVGATIVSLGTTSPEMAVSVLAAFGGDAGLALGNGVGSIIADTGLIFGVGCLMAALPADRFVLNRQGWVQIGSALLLAAICYGLWAFQGDAATITRPVGVLLTLLLVAYLVVSVKWAKQHPSGEPHVVIEGETATTDKAQHAEKHGLAMLFGMGLIGLAIVVVAGDALVQSVAIVAEKRGIPDAVIASTIVALGTSLPELVTGLTAIRKGHPELLVGNVIGADILNVLFVIGFSALAAPLPIIDMNPETTYPAIFLLLPVPTMLIMLVYMRLCIFRAAKRGHFERWMGVPLVVSYLAYLVLSYLWS